MFILYILKFLCMLGSHDYKKSMVSSAYKKSNDTILERKLRGWYNFRECKNCGKIQEQRVIMGFGELKEKKKWTNLTPSGLFAYKRYSKYLKK